MPEDFPIDATVIETPAKVEAGDHVFIPVIFGAGTLHKLSKREDLFILKLLETGGNLRAACLEIGVEMEAGRKYLKRKHIKAYLDDMFKRAARARGLNVDKLLAKLDGAIDGHEDLTEKQMEAIKTAAKILRPSGAVNVNLTQQTINVGNSPIAKLNVQEITATMQSRLKEIHALQSRPQV